MGTGSVVWEGAKKPKCSWSSGNGGKQVAQYSIMGSVALNWKKHATIKDGASTRSSSADKERSVTQHNERNSEDAGSGSPTTEKMAEGGRNN